MLTEILRREPTALSWTARAGGFVVPPPTRPHSFSLVVRTCRLVGERGGAVLRIFPALVFLIVVRMLARPAFGHSIKCSPDSPWAIDEFAPERRRTPALHVMEGCATIRREPCWQFGERKRSNGCDPIDGVRVHPTLGGSAATGHYQSSSRVARRRRRGENQACHFLWLIHSTKMSSVGQEE